MNCLLLNGLLLRFNSSLSTLPALNGALNTARQNLSPDKQRLLKAVIIGTPNAGKSTLVNQIIGHKVLAVSPKVHTTRQLALGVLTEGCNQVILLDTPGVIPFSYSRRLRLSKAFITGPARSTELADLILVVIDASNKRTRLKLDEDIIRILQLYPTLPVSLILNKVDLVHRKYTLLTVTDSLLQTQLEINGTKKAIDVTKVFMTSALSGDGVSELKDYLLSSTKVLPWEYDASCTTDLTPETIVEDIIREKLFLNLDKEIPYVLTQVKPSFGKDYTIILYESLKISVVLKGAR
jgi:GTP-binding protein Era